jgi:DNA-binding NarL/FixJ family response regulator
MAMLGDDAAVGEALRAGARGYVVKGPAGEILDASSSAPRHRTRSRISPRVSTRSSNLLAANASIAQIAATLGLSAKTVRNHVSSI